MLITIVLLVVLALTGISYWVRSSQFFLGKQIKRHGVETTGTIVDIREKPFHGTKIAYMMNVEYETPQGKIKRYYKRIIVKDRIIPYKDKYGKFFYKGQELPIAYLPQKPDKFVVLHPIEIEEKKRTNYLMIACVFVVVVLPFIVYGLKNLFA